MVTGQMTSPGTGEVEFQVLASLGLCPDNGALTIECDPGPFTGPKDEPKRSIWMNITFIDAILAQAQWVSRPIVGQIFCTSILGLFWRLLQTSALSPLFLFDS